MSPIALKTVISEKSLLVILVIVFVCPLLEVSLGFAQATTSITSTSGIGDLRTTVTTHGHTVQITGGTRPGNGTNLFHSFDQFNVGHGDTAQFLNTTPSLSISNILSRVTGGNPSSIFGTIDTMSYPGANLFLMNPAGIIFGPNATLNVGGSVAFTTAEYLRFADVHGSNAGIFHSDPAATNLLTSASVVAFGFLGSNPSAIAIQGSTLTVQPGKSISLVGGNQGFRDLAGTVPDGVTLTGGHLRAPDGQINIASIASPGEILARNLKQADNINGKNFGALGTVQLSQQSSIETSGKDGGTIVIRGGRLVVDDSSMSANTKAGGPDTTPKIGPSGTGIDIKVTQDVVIDNGAVIETNVGPGAHHGSGGVRIIADHLSISGGPKISKFVRMNPETAPPFAGVRSNVEPKSTAARSGDIALNTTADILIKDYGLVETKTGSEGSAGHIALKASGNIVLDSLATVQSLSESSSGHAGNITFSGSQGHVTISGVSEITSQAYPDSSGNTGNIKIDFPRGDITLIDSRIFNSANGTGTLGNIQINAHDLYLREASKIGGDNLSPQAPGNITITLAGRLTVAEGSFINTEAFGSANSADLIIKTPTVLITGKDSGLDTSTINSGNGGHLSLFTDSLQLVNGGSLSSESFIGFAGKGDIPSGHGGVISVEGYRNPGTSVIINGPRSGIFTSAEGTGAAGDIVIKAASVTLQNGGKLSAETTGTSSKATGGSINVTATDQVALTNGASITASTSGPGNAGNILVKADNIALSGGSTITASSTGSGNAGTVTIQGLQSPSKSFFIDSVNSGIFTKTTKTGAGGDITVSSNSILIQNEGRISGETSGSAATASGGKIHVDGGQIRIESGALVTSSSVGVGPGGNISLTAGQSVTIQDGAAVSANSKGPADAGNISINAGQQLDARDSSSAITTEAKHASGGNIDIRAIDRVQLTNSTISASVGADRGNGGNITIDPNVVVLQNSQVLANAQQGNGGNITITTPTFLADQFSRVDASSQFGVNGTVTIQSPTSNLSGTVKQLTTKPSEAQALLQSRCVALAGGEQSTFIVAGRDALPSEPGGWLSSPLSINHLPGHDAKHAAGRTAKRVGPGGSPATVLPVHETQALSLRRLTPAGFLVRTFGIDGLTGCRS